MDKEDDISSKKENNDYIELPKKTKEEELKDDMKLLANDQLKQLLRERNILPEEDCTVDSLRKQLFDAMCKEQPNTEERNKKFIRYEDNIYGADLTLIEVELNNFTSHIFLLAVLMKKT